MLWEQQQQHSRPDLGGPQRPRLGRHVQHVDPALGLRDAALAHQPDLVGAGVDRPVGLSERRRRMTSDLTTTPNPPTPL